MAEILAHVGPVVAIGKPGEPLPELGAARLYVADDQWQAKVIELMGKAALVVIRLGASPGLLWEIEQSLAQAAAPACRLRRPRRRGARAGAGGAPGGRPRPDVRARAAAARAGGLADQAVQRSAPPHRRLRLLRRRRHGVRGPGAALASAVAGPSLSDDGAAFGGAAAARLARSLRPARPGRRRQGRPLPRRRRAARGVRRLDRRALVLSRPAPPGRDLHPDDPAPVRAALPRLRGTPFVSSGSIAPSSTRVSPPSAAPRPARNMAARQDGRS